MPAFDPDPDLAGLILNHKQAILARTPSGPDVVVPTACRTLSVPDLGCKLGPSHPMVGVRSLDALWSNLDAANLLLGLGRCHCQRGPHVHATVNGDTFEGIMLRLCVSQAINLLTLIVLVTDHAVFSISMLGWQPRTESELWERGSRPACYFLKIIDCIDPSQHHVQSVCTIGWRIGHEAFRRYPGSVLEAYRRRTRFGFGIGSISPTHEIGAHCLALASIKTSSQI